MTQRFIHAPCSSSTASPGDALTAARAPFVGGSLRSAPELVAKSHRVFAGVGPDETMIARRAGYETARRALGPVALEVDDLLFLLVRDLEVQRTVGAKLVVEPLPVVEGKAFLLRLRGHQRLGHDPGGRGRGGVLGPYGRDEQDRGSDHPEPNRLRHEFDLHVIRNHTPNRISTT